MTTTPNAGAYIAALRVGDLFADPTYQRDLKTARVDAMAAALDPTLLGVLEVSARDDGRYAIIDGQHRWAAVGRAAGDDAHLVCHVHSGLSVEDEARLFYEIDHARKNLSWWDRWKARRGAGDPHVLAIDEVLKRHQLQIDPAPQDGNIRATKSIQTIVDDLGDLQMLDQVLVVLTSAFGRSYDGLDGAIMQGVALVLGHYGADELDVDRLVVQLRDIPPRQIKARAVALREAHSGTVPRLCAAVIIERYNAGRGRSVEPFFSRVPSVSKAGTAYNQERRQRAAIRRWAASNGYDIAQSRNIPPSVRRAYEQAQASAPAPGETETAEAGDVVEAVTDGLPEGGGYDRAGIERAYRNGHGIRWVMDAYGVDYPTAQAIHAETAPPRRRARSAQPAA